MADPSSLSDDMNTVIQVLQDMLDHEDYRIRHLAAVTILDLAGVKKVENP